MEPSPVTRADGSGVDLQRCWFDFNAGEGPRGKFGHDFHGDTASQRRVGSKSHRGFGRADGAIEPMYGRANAADLFAL